MRTGHPTGDTGRKTKRTASAVRLSFGDTTNPILPPQ